MQKTGKSVNAMGMLSNLFQSRDHPVTDSTNGSSYRFFFGGSSSGKAVTERSAMQMPAVYSCVRILAEAIAELPLHLYRYGENGSKEKATDHPLYALLHDEPNPEMTSFVFRETLMTHLLLWGNAYAQIIRNDKGEVVALVYNFPALLHGIHCGCPESFHSCVCQKLAFRYTPDYPVHLLQKMLKISLWCYSDAVFSCSHCC
jgi:hypothetical protein